LHTRQAIQVGVSQKMMQTIEKVEQLPAEAATRQK
jgi:hypothetical protein